MAFLCFLTIDLHFPHNRSLKGKRKELQSLKAQLQRRFGAAVAETDHHELWQRSTVTAAVVARDHRGAVGTAEKLERYVESRFPDGVSIERRVASADEVGGS